MPPSVYLLREKPPLVPSSQGASALKFYIYSLLLLPGRAGVPLPWNLRSTVLAHTVCRSTHKHTAPAHSQLSSQPHTGACTRARSWYPSSWCLCLFMLASSFPLPSQVPEALGALMLVARSCSALFLLVPTGQNACVVVSDSLGVPRGCEWASGWLCAPGDVLGLLVSHFPAGFCFPQLPSGWFSRICLCRSPSLGSCVGLSIQPPRRQRMDAGAVVWGMGAVC